ncbi:MAG: MopE-related protein [Polyangiales bacterium]
MKRVLLTLVLSVGCSAVVNPDPSLLGEPGTPMGCATDCDDGVACTVDRCDGTVCVNERDNAQCADSERCDMLMGCVDASCTSDANCDDGLACNGVETCEGGRCAEGTPVVCDDGIDCTMERCNDMTGLCESRSDDAACDDGVPCTVDSCAETGCVYTPNNALCDDGFCFQGAVCTADGCQGGSATDCSDGDECTVDTCDAEALMCVNEIVDMDGDTFSPTPSCAQVDCDDTNPDIFPGAMEICDDIDQDCDGDVTDGCDPPTIPDTCDTAQLLAAPGSGPVTVSGDFGVYNADYDQECSNSRRADVVFALDLEAGRDYIIDTVGSTADTILAVTDECGDWNFAGRGCNDDIDGDNRQSRLFLRGLGDAPGLSRVYILLTRFDDTSGANWVLNVSSVASQGNMCGDQMDISAGGSVVGSISASASAFYFNGCISNGFMRREHFFNVTTPNEEVRVRSWSDDFGHSVARYRQCNRGARQCDGAASGNRTEIRWNPDRETDLILIDGADSDGGNLYTLQYSPGF